jgi:hypothetical protein
VTVKLKQIRKNCIAIALAVICCTGLMVLSSGRQSFSYGVDDGRVLISQPGGVYAYNTDGSGSTKVSSHLDQYTQFASWSPDGKKISYSSLSQNFQGSDIIIINSDGSERLNLTNTEDSVEISGVFSPDGRYIRYLKNNEGLDPAAPYTVAFTVVKDLQTGVEYEMPVNASNYELGIVNEEIDFDGRVFIFQPWSPDSKKIVVNASVEGSDWFGYWVVDRDGSNPVAVELEEGLYPTGITWISNSKLLVSAVARDRHQMVIFDSTSLQSEVIYDTNTLQSIPEPGTSFFYLFPLMMQYSPQSGKLFTSTVGEDVGQSAGFSVYSSSFSPQSGQVADITNISNGICPRYTQSCSGISSPYFSISGSGNSIAFMGVQPIENNMLDISINVQKTGGGTTKLLSVPVGADVFGFYGAIGTIHFNAFGPPSASEGNTDQQVSSAKPISPAAPKTGKLIGAFIITFSLFAIMIIGLKELSRKTKLNSLSEK